MRIFFTLLFCIFSAVLQAAVTPAELQRLKGIEQHLASGQRELAREQLERLERGALSAQAYAISRQMLAGLYGQTQQYALALETLESAAKMAGLDRRQRREITAERAKIHHLLKQWAEVVSLLKKLGKLDGPQRMMLASALYKLEHFDEAIKVLSASSSALSDQQRKLLLAAQLKAGRFEQAVGLLQRQLNAAPDRERLWLQLSAAYLQLKRSEKAAAVLHGAFMRGVLRSEKGIGQLTALLLQQGQPQQAAAVQHASIEAGWLESGAPNLLALSAMQHRAKDFAGALDSARRAQGRAPSLAGYRHLSGLLLQQRQWREAYQVLQQMVTRHTDSAGTLEVQLKMLRASYHLEDLAAANKHLSSALAIAPESSRLKSWQALLASPARSVSAQG